MQVQANIISNLFLQNIWVNVLTLDINQFKAHTFFSLILNENFEICPGFGWQTEKVLFKMLYTMKFWNCAKTLVDDLADFSKTWTGYEAKYFEECAQSNNVEVILYEKEFFEANQGQEWYGTTNAKSATYCLKLFGTKQTYYSTGLTGLDLEDNDSAMLFAKLAYKTFFSWVTETYPEAFE